MAAELTQDEKVREQANKIISDYQTYSSYQTFSVLIMGIYGVGKTRLIATMPKPVLIDSFDPKGTVVIERLYPEELKSGKIMIRRYWNEDYEKPSEYRRWEDQWEADIESGFLDNLGTYAIDSMTTWIESLANYFSVELKRDRKVQKLAINDYLWLYDVVKKVVKQSSSRLCNFAVTGHLVEEQDLITGRIEARLKTFKQLQTDIPLLFSEKYVLKKSMKGNDIVYELLTTSAGRYEASTQLGAGGTLKNVEEPDLCKIMAKIGMKVEDKPSIL